MYPRSLFILHTSLKKETCAICCEKKKVEKKRVGKDDETKRARKDDEKREGDE
jgi:hypothetical protein